MFAAAGGVAVGLAIGVGVGRATAPGPSPAAAAAEARAGATTDRAPARAPDLAGTAPPPSKDDALTFDLRQDGTMAWAALGALLDANRVEEAIVAARGILRHDPNVVTTLEPWIERLDAPADRLRLCDALRAAGFVVPASDAAYVALRVEAGRADEVVAQGLEVLSSAPPDTFQALLAAAMRRGVDGATLRGVAERDAWPAWKVAHAARQFQATSAPLAAAWAALATRIHDDEKRRAEDHKAAVFEAAVAELRAIAEGEGTAVRWTALGDTLREQGADAAGATEAYLRALDVDPFTDAAAWGLAKIAPEKLLPRIRDRWRDLPDDDRLAILATALLKTGAVEDGVATFFRGRELDGDWLLAGLASLAPDVALAAIDTRLALGPDETLELARVDALEALGRAAEARSAVTRILERSADLDDDLRQRVLALAPDLVIAWFGPDRAAMPTRINDRVTLADALRRIGKVEEARALVAPIVAADPIWSGWDGTTPFVAALDPERWLPPVEARTRDPEENTDPGVWARLAEAYRLLGRTADARRAYDEAIARDGDDMELRIRRLRLR